MSSLQEKISESIKSAMKSRDQARLSTFRLLRSDIKNKEIEIGKSLGDEEIIKLIQKMVKKFKESIDQFQKGGRQDLVEKEQKELAFLEPYLPKLLSGAELEQKIQAILDKVGATSAKQMGQVMKAVGEELSGKVDMKEVSGLVRKKLS